MNPNLIFTYFPELSEKQKSQFKELAALYSHWNSRINVISRKDFENFYIHHVLHSLGIARVIKFKSGTEIMDVGTGGGFPGIPLAIMFPEVSFYLIDSIGKKIKVVNEVAASLELGNVLAEQIRAEQVIRSFDFIISRAVTNLPEFIKWTHNKFHRKSFNEINNGILYLKGGEIEEELASLKKYRQKIYPLHDYFSEDFFETKKLVHLS